MVRKLLLSPAATCRICSLFDALRQPRICSSPAGKPLRLFVMQWAAFMISVYSNGLNKTAFWRMLIHSIQIVLHLECTYGRCVLHEFCVQGDKAIRALLSNLEHVLSALQEYFNQNTGDSNTKANGFIATVSEGGSILLCLKMVVCNDIAIEVLNTAVQSKKASILSIFLAMQLTCTSLQSMRSDVEFNLFFAETEKLCTESNSSHPQLPRQPAKATVQILWRR